MSHMAKVLYAVTMSLDGYIAGPGGDMSWMVPYFGPNPTAHDLITQVGSLLVGRRTYGGDDPNKGTDSEGAMGGQWHGPQFVLTHEPPAEIPPDTTFVTDLATAVAAAKDAAGHKYVNILGADVARQALAAGLVDEILTFVAPVMLGGGTRLFTEPDSPPVRLERLVQKEHPKAAELWYRVVR
jgi:dihydrofolate reductase